MTGYKTTFACAALVFSFATMAQSEETTTTDPAADPAVTTPAPVPGTAADATTATTADTTVPAIDCMQQFTTLDKDGDGFLSEEEAPREYARTRIDAVTLQETGISEAEFGTLCNSANWAANTPEEGAPFEGANSFTEQQARDRATAWDVMNVSVLTKDDMGIWRGTGTVNDASVDVAIDYKGNVVTTPKP